MLCQLSYAGSRSPVPCTGRATGENSNRFGRIVLTRFPSALSHARRPSASAGGAGLGDMPWQHAGSTRVGGHFVPIGEVLCHHLPVRPAADTPPEDTWVVGLDLGGTGSRAAASPGPGRQPVRVEGPPLHVVDGRSDAPDVIRGLCQDL